MTQPDLVSKLRELIARWRDMSKGETYRDGVIEFCADELESLLGREGQAAEQKYRAFCAEHDLQLTDGRCPKCRDANGNSFVLDMQSTYLVPTCGPSQPETVREGYKGICVCGHRSGAHHESDPSCEFCACKSYRDVSAWGGSPSTPIVPGTPHIPIPLAKHYEDCSDCWWNPGTGYMELCPEGGAIMLREQDNRDRKQESGEHRADSSGTSAAVPGTAGLSAEQVRSVLANHWLSGVHCHHAISPDDHSYDWASCACSEVNLPHRGTVGEAVGTWIEHVIALLGAEPGVPLIHGRAELDIHDARIRKSVLEEAAQLVEKAFEQSWVVQDTLDAIRALAERPAPAGEVRIPRCQAQHPEGGQCELRADHGFEKHLAGPILWAGEVKGEK